MSVYSYTKLDAGILDSSVWVGTPAGHKLAWLTLLAMKDVCGRVACSVQGLAKRAEISREAAQAAIDSFLAPDPDSRTPDHEGRRIEKRGDFYYILNHDKYRDQQDDDYQRIRKARNKADQRAREKAAAEAMSPPNGDMSPVSPHSYADSDSLNDDDDGRQAAPAVPCVTPKELSGENPRQYSAAQAESEKFLKTFGETEAKQEETYTASPRVQRLADIFGQHLKVTQEIDFSWPEVNRAEIIDKAPDQQVMDAVAYVLTLDTFWLRKMTDENEGAGGLKLFVRAFDTISKQTKNKGTKRRVSAKPAKAPVHKCDSVNPAISTTKFVDEGDAI
jgi:hypothetical protein